MTKAQRFKGCILGGAIGDAWGSAFENQAEVREDTFYLFDEPTTKAPDWVITDDTQLTLATIEAMTLDESINPVSIANQFLKYYKKRILKGLGSSTLKALRELEVGGHWSQVGRRGEYAAGNGAAMRIAPLAFVKGITDAQIRDICAITHHNDEAYIGARCIVLAIQEILSENWDGQSNLIEKIIPQIPDTRIRDKLIEIKDVKSLEAIGALGNDGYVVNSIPLAIAAANQISDLGMENMFTKLIEIGGDTDTNCAIAGQITGAFIGDSGIPEKLLMQLKDTQEFDWIERTIMSYSEKRGWVASD